MAGRSSCHNAFTAALKLASRRLARVLAGMFNAGFLRRVCSGTMVSRFMGLRGVLIIIGVLTSTASALAQDVAAADPGAPSEEAAKALYAAARAEYDAGQFKNALLHFRDAYDQSMRPQLLYNVGLAADRLRYNQTARDAFVRYLKELPDADNRVEVENRIKALREIIDREAAASRAPSAVAAAAPVLAGTDARTSAPPKSDRQEASGGGLMSKWWFWTVAGVVVAGATTGIIVATSGDTVGKRVVGTDGLVVATLRLK